MDDHISTREEMLELLAAKVQRIYGMSIAEYLFRRHHGTLPYKPEGVGLEIISGES